MAGKFFPISVRVKGRNGLVVGGGKVALRKIELLLDCDINLTVVAPEAEPKIKFYAEEKRLTFQRREYRQPEAASYRLVIAASDDPELNKTVYNDCRDSGALVNVVDSPRLCDFVFPAMVRRDALTIAISTDGTAPFLAASLRTILDDLFPSRWNKIIQLAGAFRKRVLKTWPDDFRQRTRCFEEFVAADWKTMLKELSDEEIAAALDQMLKGS